jgi:hypothetical protein
MITIKEEEGQDKGAVFCCETLPNHIIVVVVVDAMSFPIFTGVSTCRWGQYWGQQRSFSRGGQGGLRAAMAAAMATALVMTADNFGVMVMAIAAVRLVSMAAAVALATKSMKTRTTGQTT